MLSSVGQSISIPTTCRPGEGLMTLYRQLRDQEVLSVLLADAAITEVEGPKKSTAKKSTKKAAKTTKKKAVAKASRKKTVKKTGGSA